MPAAKSSANCGPLVPAAAESGRKPGRIRLAKALATRPAARIPGMVAPAQAKKSKSRRYKLSDDEHVQLAALRQRMERMGTSVKKGQLLRAGLALLIALNDLELAQAVAQVGVIEADRQPQQAS